MRAKPSLAFAGCHGFERSSYGTSRRSTISIPRAFSSPATSIVPSGRGAGCPFSRRSARHGSDPRRSSGAGCGPGPVRPVRSVATVRVRPAGAVRVRPAGPGARARSPDSAPVPRAGFSAVSSRPTNIASVAWGPVRTRTLATEWTSRTPRGLGGDGRWGRVGRRGRREEEREERRRRRRRRRRRAVRVPPPALFPVVARRSSSRCAERLHGLKLRVSSTPARATVRKSGMFPSNFPDD